MSQSPSRRYTTIFYSCLLVTVILIGAVMVTSRKPGSDSSPGEQTTAGTTTRATPMVTTATTMSVTMHWTAEELRTMMSDSISQEVDDVKIEKVTLTEPDIVIVSGTIARSTLETLLQNSEIEGKSALAMAMKLLPGNIDATISFYVEAKSGTLNLEAFSFEAGSIVLPIDLLSEEMFRGVNEQIAEALEQRRCRLRSIKIEDDVLYLACTVG